MVGYDVAVVGLGPSGALFAWMAASMGYRVVGYDFQRIYRKPCGDAVIVNREYEALLRRSNSITGVVRRHIIDIDGEKIVEVNHSRPAWYIIDKTEFVGYLREAALSEGVHIIYRSMKPESVKKRVAVDARGPYAHSPSKNTWVMAYRALVKNDAWPEDTALLRFETTSSGILWIFPGNRRGIVNVGGGVKGATISEVKRYIMSMVREKLGVDAEVIEESVAPIAVYSKVDPVKEGIVRLGEASGLINSAGGEGIRMALLSALRTKEILAKGLEEFNDRYPSIIQDLVSEAILSRKLLYTMEKARPGLGRKILAGLPVSFWRGFLRGELSRTLIARSLINRPRTALLVLRALLSSQV